MARTPLQRHTPGTMTWDGLWLAGLWLALTAIRIWFREIWTLDLLKGEAILEEVDFISHAPLVFPTVACWLFWLHRLGAYRRLAILAPGQLIGVSLLALCTMLSLLFSVRGTDELSRTLCFGFALISGPVLWQGRRTLLWLQRKGVLPVPSWKVLLVGDDADLQTLKESLGPEFYPGVQLIEPTLPHPENDNNSVLEEALDVQVVDHVLVGPGWTEESLRSVGKCCEEVGLSFSVDANFLGLNRARPDLWSLGDGGVLSFSTTPSEGALAVKRSLDLSMASVLLVLTMPLLLLTGMAIRLFDGGPAIYRQTRMGQNGRPFTFYKFRSMMVDADKYHSNLAHLNEMSGPVFKMKQDPRVTRLGALLRRASIDELPQLWNVLRGEMSMVGPRPPLPNEVARYERWQLRRLSMKPGLTCIWQVSGRSEVDFQSWMRQDLEYIDNWSLSLDFRLLARTVPAVLSGSGAH